MSMRHNLIASLLLSGLATGLPAFAKPGDCTPMAGWEKFHEQRAGRIEQHQKHLHDALKLSADQEPAWKKFTESMQRPARPERGNRDEWAKLTTPERAEKMLDLAKQRQERMAEHVSALKSFYSILTPEQRKVFDEQHMGPRGGHRGQASGGESSQNPPAAAAKS